MAAEQVLLQGEHLVGVDALVGELAEAGVDAVDGGPVCQQPVEAAAGLLDPKLKTEWVEPMKARIFAMLGAPAR